MAGKHPLLGGSSGTLTTRWPPGPSTGGRSVQQRPAKPLQQGTWWGTGEVMGTDAEGLRDGPGDRQHLQPLPGETELHRREEKGRM